MRKSLTHAAVLAVIVVLTAGSVLAANTAPASSSAGVVNINTADASQLSLLPRVGAKAAERIIEYRKANGPFKKTTDLMQVKGIGDKSFELLSPYLTVDGKTTLTTKQHAPRRPRTSKSKTEPASTAH